jgi:hypothetical protein
MKHQTDKATQDYNGHQLKELHFESLDTEMTTDLLVVCEIFS